VVQYEGFTEEARRVVVLAQAEAIGLGRHSIEPQLLLIAMLRHYPWTADRLLRSGNCTSASLLRQLDDHFPVAPGTDLEPRELPFSWEARHLLDKARKSAKHHRHDWIGIEHLMIGLVSYPQAAFTWLRTRIVAKVFLQENGVYRQALDAAVQSIERPIDGQHRGPKEARG
jgi:ATP-dependent Clp protease ATP-binding subunit ClpC